MTVHHIGYLVKNIDKAVVRFQSLGFESVSETVYDSLRKVNICFMKNGGYVIELVSPAAPDSVVSSLIKQYRNCPYHLCYLSNDFDKECEELLDRGFTSIGEPQPALAIENRRVGFFVNAYIGIIEVVDGGSR